MPPHEAAALSQLDSEYFRSAQRTRRSLRDTLIARQTDRTGRAITASERMKRREFITLLGGAAAAWSLPARAQQPSMPLIGFLHGGSAEANQGFTSTFRQGLKQTGFSEGQNLAIEFRWADGHYDRLPTLASDLIGRQPTVIVAAGGDNSARAAIAATTKIPIVFVAGSDPSKSGLVRSLNKPGGNATGVSIFSTEVVGKQLDLPHELMPEATVIGMFVNPNNPNADTQIRGAQEAALARGVGLDVVNVGDDRDLDPAFARLLERRIGAVVVGADPIFLPSAINSLGSQPAMDCR